MLRAKAKLKHSAAQITSNPLKNLNSLKQLQGKSLLQLQREQKFVLTQEHLCLSLGLKNLNSSLGASDKAKQVP